MLLGLINYFFENNRLNKQETKKLTTAPTTAIITVNSTSFKLILKMVESKVPPITPDFICKSLYNIRLSLSQGLSLSLSQGLGFRLGHPHRQLPPPDLQQLPQFQQQLNKWQQSLK